MGNYTKSFNFRNGVQVDDSNFIVNSVGLVGIGTSVPTKRLDVRGNAKIIGDTTLVGLASITDLNVVGVVTIGSAVKIDSGSGIVTATKFVGDASGLSNIVAIATDGFVANTGTLSTTAKIGIGSEAPSTQLDVLGDSKFVGFTTFAGNLDVNGNTTLGDETSDTLTINASTKIVNDDKFYIQSVNNGGASNTGVGISFSDHVTAGSRQVGEINYKHEDLLSPEANYSDTFTFQSTEDDLAVNVEGTLLVGVTTSNNGGKVGIGTSIPTEKLDVNGSTIIQGDLNVLGFSTFADLKVRANTQLGNAAPDVVTIIGSVNQSEGGLNVSGLSTFSSNVDIDADLDVDGHTELDNLNVSGVTTLGSGGSGSVVLEHGGDTVFNTVSTGASVFNQLSVASLNGGASGLSSHFGSLRYGNESGGSPYSTRRSLDLINTDSGNINYYLNANDLSTPVGGSNFFWHKGFNTNRLMTLTGIGGSLGIGITLPTHKLHVQGDAKISAGATFGGDIFVSGDISLTGSIEANVTGDLLGNVTGNVNATSGISTFNDISAGVSTVTSIKTDKIGVNVDVGNNPVEINTDNNRVFVSSTGNLGIRTDDTFGNSLFNAGATVSSIVGVGTTLAKSAVDFADAGKDITGAFANKMFMLPPKITTAERGNLTGVTDGALIYNTDGNQLQVYIGGWVGIGTTTKVDS